jgi:hypothetical protein
VYLVNWHRNSIVLLLFFAIAGCSEYSDYWTNNNEKISALDGITIFVEKSDIVERGFFLSGERGAETVFRQIKSYKITEKDGRLLANLRGNIQCKNVELCDNFPRKYYFNDVTGFGISYSGDKETVEYSSISDVPYDRSDSICISDAPPVVLGSIIKILRHGDSIKYVFRTKNEEIDREKCRSFNSPEINDITVEKLTRNFISDVMIIGDRDFCAIYIGVDRSNSISFAKDICFIINRKMPIVKNVDILDKFYSRGYISYFLKDKYPYVYDVDSVCAEDKCIFKIKAYSNDLKKIVTLSVK